MCANLVQIATSPNHPQSVAAFNALCDRAYGRPRPSEEETDAVAKSGIQLIYVDRPFLLPGVPIIDEKDVQRELPPPVFEDK